MNGRALIETETIWRLLRDYRRESGFRAIEVDAVGRARGGIRAGNAGDAWRAALFGEAVRWGEACVMTDDRGVAGWGIPLMTNSIVTGGIIVENVALDDGDPAEISRRIQSAAEHLLAKMESSNITNAARIPGGNGKKPKRSILSKTASTTASATFISVRRQGCWPRSSGASVPQPARSSTASWSASTTPPAPAPNS